MTELQRRLVILLAISATLSACGTAPSAVTPTAVTPHGPEKTLSQTVAAPALPVLLAPAPTVSVTASTEGDAEPSAADLLPDDPPNMSMRFTAASEVTVADFKSDHTPYLPVVTERGAHYVTIAWHTEQPTTGIVEYGRAWKFDQHGYTDKFTDSAMLTDHMITLNNLKRWTGYEFRVTGVTSLGLSFPEKQRSFRTRFWAWR